MLRQKSGACFPTGQISLLQNLFTGWRLMKVKSLKNDMFVRVVETSYDQLSFWNNGDILPSWVNKQKTNKQKKEGGGD